MKLIFESIYLHIFSSDQSYIFIKSNVYEHVINHATYFRYSGGGGRGSDLLKEFRNIAWIQQVLLYRRGTTWLFCDMYAIIDVVYVYAFLHGKFYLVGYIDNICDVDRRMLFWGKLAVT